MATTYTKPSRLEAAYLAMLPRGGDASERINRAAMVLNGLDLTQVQGRTRQARAAEASSLIAQLHDRDGSFEGVSDDAARRLLKLLAEAVLGVLD